MRILWVVHNLAYPPKGGVLQRNFNLLREVARNCELHVIALDQSTLRPPGVAPEDCVGALREFCTSVEWLPLPETVFRGSRYVHAIRGLTSREPFDFHWFRSRKMAEKIRETLTRVPFDVVHFDTLGLAQYRPIVGGPGTVLNHHNVESIMMERRAMNERNILRKFYWSVEAGKLRGAEHVWCPRFDANLVVSKDDEACLAGSIAGVEVRVVPNGVDTDYFSPRPDPGGRVLLFTGTMDWYPNREAMRFFFNAIWPMLTRSCENMEIYVVGPRPPRWLERLSAEDGRIHVTGFVNDVRPYFRKTSVYVCPIRDGGGTRLKILDALAMGVPLVGTSFSCSGLAVENGRHVLLAETPEDFVNQIQEALSNVALRRMLARNGRELIEEAYSWSVIGRRLVGVYEHVRLVRRDLRTV